MRTLPTARSSPTCNRAQSPIIGLSLKPSLFHGVGPGEVIGSTRLFCVGIGGR